jgi:hypothetical protein
MKNILIVLLLLPINSIGQSLIDIQISYQTSVTSHNTVRFDSVLVESGFGQSSSLKFHLLVFDTECKHVDSMKLGEYNPFNTNFKAYHFRQNQAYDLGQLDSTLKYRIPYGFHYFIYTPCQYRKDFVSTAFSPFLQTLDSLWGSQVKNTETAFIAYGIKGFPESYESIIVDPSDEVISMTKVICFDAGIIDFQNDNYPEPFLFPNPTSNLLNISFFDKRNRSIQFFDLTSKLVNELNSVDDSIELDVSDFEPGHYFLRIQDEQGTFFKQLLIE